MCFRCLKILLAGRTKGWLFPSYRECHISSRQVQNTLDGIATRTGLQEVKRKDKQARTGTVYILICSGTALQYGASIVACQWVISRIISPHYNMASFLSLEVKTCILQCLNAFATGDHRQFTHTTARRASKRSSGTEKAIIH
jgi:hypothetical protein